MKSDFLEAVSSSARMKINKFKHPEEIMLGIQGPAADRSDSSSA